MDTNKAYETGADFFRDTAVSHGTEEALSICGRYLGTQLRKELPEDEKIFCCELFAAIYEETASRTDPAKLVYPYDFQTAKDRWETSHYHDSGKRNAECAHAIDEIINASCYEPNYYNLELAAMKAVHDFGFNRVNLVLAHNIQQRENDGRFTSANKRWAREFSVGEEAFGGATLNAHPVLIDGFARHTRKLYDAVGAERFALPGRPESGEAVHGYEIVRAVTFDNQRGFAIGLNPNAANTFVAWQFTVENGRRDYYWGHYADELGSAAQSYIARTLVHMSDNGAREMPNPLAAAEMSREQNYNMIDGLHNNEAVPPADLTDGQTWEEIRELAPETLPEAKVSVLEQIREAREAPAQPSKPKPERERKAPELER